MVITIKARFEVNFEGCLISLYILLIRRSANIGNIVNIPGNNVAQKLLGKFFGKRVF